jgi:hypothetical protein
VACWGLEVRESANNGQIGIRVRRWCCGLYPGGIYQGYTSRFPGYVSRATMLLVSELGASTKNLDKRGENFILDL